MPIYNVEKYVKGTLSSIYDQDVDEQLFEVIVVNDGTPDNSMAVVNEFAGAHVNLVIINQKNQGLSAARNAGMRVAKGAYVWFVDSDDKLETDSLNYILGLLDKENSDILGFGLTRIGEDGRELSKETPFVKSKYYHMCGKLFSGKRLFHKLHIGIVQRYIYKASFLRDNKLSFYPGIWYEDDQFSVRAFFLAKKVRIIDFDIYRYLVRNSGNIMSSVSMKSVYDTIKIITSWQEFSAEHAINFVDKAIFNDAIADYCFFIFAFRKHHLDDYENFISENATKYRKLAIVSTLKSLKYLSKRKIVCFLAMLFCPMLTYRFY